ncbi:MAG: hypothetical protein A2360_05120 [Candidatus Staskawiczbacteria bacterium RIFOXYB1_FULL_32_11]|uniref:Uncharacterized protein n=1 Tax=Candidatus Staskawiczbacteria bacterium RIFOXYD1_FULL_32_13 TaxID=1802234 RepID=A0A1G2JMV6_9BACT|nr:MAG: hypothetical protein UR22_C0036G0001 [Parcubacteria group bacterium GW2011_GWC2_32_10]OGZ78488.1 MAG: hypothetical protein A2360_05120 [Candidatus Staskawiczbacteria bacterium RIFOXYB1_FULL_32_11]OGZ88475.1 MAG: hypothetical protein A2561_03875 [Candidatus Staskawiczbacteria bacterium RIFOXYD1_FULL_32_13]
MIARPIFSCRLCGAQVFGAKYETGYGHMRPLVDLQLIKSGAERHPSEIKTHNHEQNVFIECLPIGVQYFPDETLPS